MHASQSVDCQPSAPPQPDSPTPEVSIRAIDLSHRFGNTTALRKVSFSILKGEVVGFLGPNGAGKSTTLRILTGALPATSGFAEVCGRPVPDLGLAVRSHIGFMPENNPLPEDLRVIEFLRLRARLKGIPSRNLKAAVDRALEVCQLQHKARRRIIGSLSKGFRQRVGIADAILAEPPVTILDEPTIGLDPHQVIAIRQLLNSLRGQTTVIFSSHILSEVELACDRVLILNQGRLVAAGTLPDLRKDFCEGPQLIIESPDAFNSLQSALHRFDPALAANAQACQSPTGLRVTNLPEDFDPSALIRFLSQDPSLRIHAFQRSVPSLEDVFLAATRRAWATTEPALSA